jgi:hypothetical protein
VTDFHGDEAKKNLKKKFQNGRFSKSPMLKFVLRISDFEKRPFKKTAFLEIFFCFITMKISQSYLGIKDSSKF